MSNNLGNDKYLNVSNLLNPEIIFKKFKII